MDINPEYETVEAARPPRNLVLLAFPIGAAGLLAYTTHIALVSWVFGLSLIAWCAVMLVWLLQHDDR
jgi:hypothetical protein